LDMSETNGDIRNENGTFAKGNPGKPKGAVVKVSVKVRESIVAFLEANVDKIQADFDTLKPRERLQFVAEILAYAAPKLSAVQTEVNATHSGGITVRWEEPSVGRDKGTTGVIQSLQSGVPDNS
jgi:hypothetical protein